MQFAQSVYFVACVVATLAFLSFCFWGLFLWLVTTWPHDNVFIRHTADKRAKAYMAFSVLALIPSVLIIWMFKLLGNF